MPGLTDGIRQDLPSTVRRVGTYVPVTVLGFALVSGYIASNDVGFVEVFGTHDYGDLFDPVLYTANVFFHAGGWSHYTSNMVLWIPFGAVLTWLTSNRHVFGLVVAVNVMTVAIALPIEGLGLGMSHVVFAVVAATFASAIGHGLQHASMTTLQTVLAGLLGLFVGGFLLVMVLAGPRRIADFYHVLGFLFGGAIEAMLVFENHER